MTDISPKALRSRAEKQRDAGNLSVAIDLKLAADKIEELERRLKPPEYRNDIMTYLCIGGPYDGLRHVDRSGRDFVMIALSQSDPDPRINSSMDPCIHVKEYGYHKDSMMVRSGDYLHRLWFWRYDKMDNFRAFEHLLAQYGELTMLEERLVNTIGGDAVRTDFHHKVPRRR